MIVRNKVLASFFDGLDYPVRYLYSRMPFISRLFFWQLYSSNYTGLDMESEQMIARLPEGFLRGKTCLELGPGNSYINAYNLLMHGAKKVYLVDKFPRIMRSRRQRDYFREEIKHIERKYRRKACFLRRGRLNPEMLEFMEGDISTMRIGRKVDLIYSISVLEHVKDVGRMIRALASMLKKGGYAYHTIDLRDHYNFANPFLFYKYSEREWSRITREGVSYTNRVRYHDFKEMHEQAGFRIVDVQLSQEELGSVKINKIFRGRDDLEITKARMLCRR